ncbi:MAG: PIG-L deacetylase family protein [Acidimicrobiales bacterium]|jgi:LmbE family N-acetylglucosaminyl deacetylase
MSEALLDEVPARALAIYAHPDDPFISCGGTLARWTAAGSTVDVVICTAGDKGTTDPDTDPEALRASRVVEAECSAEVLALNGLHLLGHLDGELENDGVLRRELVQIIRDMRPEAIVSPDPLAVFFGEHHYNHRDHRVVGWAALDAAAPAAALPLYFRGAGVAHQVAAAYLSGSLKPNVWVDVSSTIDKKIEAVSCHISQLADAGDWIASALRDGAEQAGREAGVGYAEPFRRIWLAP